MEQFIVVLCLILLFMTASLIGLILEKNRMKRDIEIARYCLKRHMDYESYHDLKNLDGM